MRFTVSPVLGRLMWRGILRKLFGPNPVPEEFERFPKWLALRPGQVRAAAEESALMVPAAARLRKRYARLSVPAVLVAGAEDRIVDTQYQTEALARELPESAVHVVPGAGHMIHHVAPDTVLRAIDEAAGSVRTPASAR
jgi:pimeloyl-ACP methyl ester carboxylesterase